VTAMAGRIALRWGGATDVGRVRSTNQDSYLARDDVGIWAVADGMGGHRGGEVASQIACEALGRSFTDRTVDGLIDAIGAANAAVFQAGAGDPELTGMGTTIVGLAVIDETDGEQLAIANVGDSRVYRFSVGELDQLTDDHSLVADMVREGSLSPEEAAVHPQRNIVTRVLGVYEEVPVDALTVEPRHGDRYVLCSDGLFNEVTEPAIAAVLRRVGDPSEAAAELVHRALEAGGRDNVTVVVVDVVDDGGQSPAASAAATDVGGAGGTARHATIGDRPRADDGELDTEAQAGGRRGRRARARAEEDGDAGDRAPGSRRITWRVVAFVVLLLALIGGAVATIQWYGRSTYFVGFEEDRVTIFKGRPGGLLWLDPELVESSDLHRDRVPADVENDIDAGKEQSTLSGARAYVDRVAERADELSPRTTTTTTTTQPRGETTTTARQAMVTTTPS
jgi:PPM family protein phosphatase